MARTEEGEFELVLGNRQLISVFLIVVILLGVFFSMGYIVGRNSAPVAVESRNVQPSKPIVVETPHTAPKDTEQPPPAIEPAPQAAAPDTKAGRTPPAPEKAEKKEPVKAAPTPPPVQEAKPAPPPEPASSATVEQPPSGRYWQVVSTGQHEAQIIAGAISKKGMKSLVAPAPKPGFFRVLIGPLGDASDVAKTRSALEAAGFKNPILAKY